VHHVGRLTLLPPCNHCRLVIGRPPRSDLAPWRGCNRRNLFRLIRAASSRLIVAISEGIASG
jgi:hypothetical protein